VTAVALPVIDVHVHFIPDSLVAAVEKGLTPSVSVETGPAGLVFSFPGMAPSPPAQAALHDSALLLTSGTTAGIDLRLVGPWTDLLGYTLPERDASSWTRAYNESLAASCAGHPGLVPVATAPLQFPELAAREVEEAHHMGCRGLMIGTDIPGLGFDSPSLEPVWEAAAGLGMPVIAHPTFLVIPPRLRRRGLKNAVGRAEPALVALTELVYSGALLRHPQLSVIAAMGGGGLVSFAGRIVRNHQLGWSDTDVDVSASLDRLYFDTCLDDSTHLRYLVSRVGAHRLLLGSDHPFPWEPDPVGKVRRANLEPEEHAAVVGGNARELFHLGR